MNNEDIKPGYKRTEVGVIPEEWGVDTAESLTPRIGKFGIVDGPFGSNLKTIHYRKSGVPIITSGYVTGGRFYADTYVYVDKGKFEQEKRSAVKAGDIVMAKIGARCGASAILPDCHEISILSGNALKITVDQSRHSTQFIWQLLWDLYSSGRIDELRTVGAQPAISMANLKKFKLPLPPLYEQQSIANALSDVDALLAKLDQLIAKKRDLKQATMQQLLTGQTRLPGFSGAWQVKRLGDVFDISAGKSKSAYVITGGQYWVVDMGSISTDGKLVVSKATNYSDDLLNAGDLAMPKDDIGGGGIIGKVGYIDADQKYVLGDHVYRLTACHENSLFLSYVINCHKTNSELRKKVIGSAQLGLGRKSVDEQEIAFPTYEEQTAIAAVLSDMDAELATLESRRDKTRALKQGMMQELLTGRIRLV